ncbi:putative membrane protein [Rubritalea squalenifaciens DSM 18772]|uniref:DUF420 domain-containing protein n=2 Tax=Rubritalea TaxID=361050 RepID=A0ABP9V2Q5_9BACT|nr:DUF420 domain-containing protein [Rubritalea squalenifaciens]SHJ78038.1 putative membrane protein [Rubritalea squalenifaciens DSM 18772]
MSEYKEYLQRKPKLAEGRKMKWVAWVLTAVVLILVGMMRRPELKFALPEGVEFSFLPPIHAALNTIVAMALMIAVMAIKAKKVVLHKRAIAVAMTASVLFLLCYVAYHFTTMETIYGDFDKNGKVDDIELARVGIMRGVYLIVLFSHIVLAGVSLPFILYTWIYGMTNQFAKHKKMAKWVFPVWLYVAVTGPVCYFMLKPFY